MSCDLPKGTRPALWIGVILIALLSALPYAGSWNDGSRLASVESLVDAHDWSIDHSIFVGAISPPFIGSDGGSHFHILKYPGKGAYPPDDLALQRQGTLDKLFINGHYYSDKSPLPSIVMAQVYKGIQRCTGLVAAHSPALFCYVMTVIFSGLAYVVAVCCVDAMVATLGVTCVPRLLLSYSFALGTTALPYTRQVNNHIMLLAVFSAVMFTAVAYAQPGGITTWRALMLGSLIGIGYTIDLGAGPVLVLCVAGFVAMQSRSVKAVIVLLGMAFPWFLAHHFLNYQLGGTFMPANSAPKYFEWPGSPFNAQNLTGAWAHPNVWHFLIYAVDLLFGKKGFIGHNLALYLALPAIVMLVRNRAGKRPLLYLSLGLIVGTWLIYAATSNNYSGLCCSVRWFVPLLAPFYCLLAMFLKEHPEFTPDLLVLSAWSVAMGAIMWFDGPWAQHMVPGFWAFQGGALLSWLAIRWRAWKHAVPIENRK